MFRTKLIVMTAILAMAFCLPGAAEARGDHHGKKHRHGGRPFRALLNHINELEAKMEALSLEMSNTSSTPDNPAVSGQEMSFLATLGSDFAALNNNRVIFDFVVHDDGSNYDSAGGIFTAPESGVYRFDSTVFYDLTPSGKTTALLQILFNGQPFDLARKPVITGTSETLDYVSGGITVRLAQGDMVQILYVGPTIRRSIFPNALGGTCFTGHQLYSSDAP